MIKPIQTEYKGYRFRSRLEARWAVFFDACGADWEYEPEGFELEGGDYYLPDFLLRDVSGRCKKFYVEVKGEMTEEDSRKIEKFGKHEPILVVGAIPKGVDFDDIYESIYAKWSSTSLPIRETAYFSFELLDGDAYCAFPYITKTGRFAIDGGGYLDDIDNEATAQAYREARQARFEHGEHPNNIHQGDKK